MTCRESRQLSPTVCAWMYVGRNFHLDGTNRGRACGRTQEGFRKIRTYAVTVSDKINATFSLFKACLRLSQIRIERFIRKCEKFKDC